MSDKHEEFELIPSSGNVFADLDIPESEEYLAKAQLAYQINKIISQRKWKQQYAAQILGIDQPKVSALSRGQLSGFSIERLIGFLNKLNQDVEIVVRVCADPRADFGHLTVALMQ